MFIYVAMPKFSVHHKVLYCIDAINYFYEQEISETTFMYTFLPVYVDET